MYFIVLFPGTNRKGTLKSLGYMADKLIKLIKTSKLKHHLISYDVDAKLELHDHVNITKAAERSVFIIHYGHGEANQLEGEKGTVIINNNNFNILAGYHIYTISCYSGQKLGFDFVNSGGKSFIGYSNGFLILKYLKKPSIKIFEQVANSGLVHIINNGTHSHLEVVSVIKNKLLDEIKNHEKAFLLMRNPPKDIVLFRGAMNKAYKKIPYHYLMIATLRYNLDSLQYYPK